MLRQKSNQLIHVLEANMKLQDCLKIAQETRSAFFEKKFGEIVSDNMYDHLRDEIHISILCLTKKYNCINGRRRKFGCL